MKKILFLSIVAILLAVPFFGVNAHNGDDHAYIPERATVYYNEACGMCATYVKESLPRMLATWGVDDLEYKDYVNERSNRAVMNSLMSQSAVPLDLQSHIMTFVGDKYLIGGHVPSHIIDGIFAEENQNKFKRIIVYQDEMHDEALEYKVWAIPAYADDYLGEIKTYPINTPINDYLDYLEKNRDQLAINGKIGGQLNKLRSLLPVVLVSGFLDGINPCAFAVLLFFIAFLFSLKRTKAAIWKMGVVYISAIFLAYLLIGVGITKALLFANAPHFMAQLGAWLVIVLGIINILNLHVPSFPIKLRIPSASKDTLQKWIQKATLPAAFVLGFLVGLCTFPCSGGIYVAIIGLLAVKTTYWSGFGYLLLYNVMFVVPLIIILLMSSNKYAVEKLTSWEQSESKIMKLVSAFTMVALGAIILIFFT